MFCHRQAVVYWVKQRNGVSFINRRVGRARRNANGVDEGHWIYSFRFIHTMDLGYECISFERSFDQLETCP